MTISEGHKANFETLEVAAKNGDICLMQVYDRTTGADVIITCATYQDEEENINFVPLARMFDSNPYDNLVTEKENIAKYRGHGTGADAGDRVWVDVRDGDRWNVLSWRETWNRGPRCAVQGLTWGSDSSLQCAWAILVDHLGDAARSLQLYEQFHEDVISKLEDSWTLSALELDSWVAHAENAKEGSEEDEDNTPTPLKGLVNAFGQPISSEDL